MIRPASSPPRPRASARPPVVRLPGVYPPQDDTALLIAGLEMLDLHPQTRLLDVCTGTGAVAVAASVAGAGRVEAVDSCRRAVWSARLNAAVRGAPVRVRRGDAAAYDGTYDVIVGNPPYVPSMDAGPPRGAARAWDAGRDGRALIEPLCRRLPQMLTESGTLMLVQSELADIDRTVDTLAAQGLTVTVPLTRRIPFGPVLRGRERDLIRGGRIAPGSRSETIAVIRADRPVHSSSR